MTGVLTAKLKKSELLCMVCFDLGLFYFHEKKHQKAGEMFQKSHALLIEVILYIKQTNNTNAIVHCYILSLTFRVSQMFGWATFFTWSQYIAQSLQTFNQSYTFCWDKIQIWFMFCKRWTCIVDGKRNQSSFLSSSLWKVNGSTYCQNLDREALQGYLKSCSCLSPDGAPPSSDTLASRLVKHQKMNYQVKTFVECLLLIEGNIRSERVWRNTNVWNMHHYGAFLGCIVPFPVISKAHGWV